MKSTMQTLERNRVRLAIDVPFSELEAGLTTDGRRAVGQLDVAGLRTTRIPFQAMDQRGGATVLPEAMEGMILAQIFAAAREHDVNLLGRPEVAITASGDGQPLRFTAVVDVRPQIILPDLSSIVVEVDPAMPDGQDIEEQLDHLRQQYTTHIVVERPAADGDLVQFELIAIVDGVEIQGGRAGDVCYEIGSGQLPAGLDDVIIDTDQLLAGLDEAITGRSAHESTTMLIRLVEGNLGGKDADVGVTVTAVKHQQPPQLDDAFARLVSQCDTLAELRGHLLEQLTRRKQTEQLFVARTDALKQIITAAAVPAPEGVVRDEVEHRRQWMSAELERVGTSLAEYLAAADKTHEDIDIELVEATAERVRSQLVLDTVADADDIRVSDDEVGKEIARRAQRAGVTPEAYQSQLVQNGTAAGFVGDVRRGKALAVVMERITMTDTGGAVLTLDDLLGAAARVVPTGS